MSVIFEEIPLKKDSLSIEILYSHGKSDHISTRKTEINLPFEKRDFIEIIIKETFKVIRDIEKKVKKGISIEDISNNFDIDSDESNRDILFLDIKEVEVTLGLEVDEHSSDLKYAIPYHALFKYYDENGKVFNVKI